LSSSFTTTCRHSCSHLFPYTTLFRSPRLRDPDAGGVARGAELNARRKRAVVVAEVAGDEEVQPVADDRAAQGEAVLLLLIVGDGYGHAVRIAAHEILVLHVRERRPMELVDAGLGDRVD